MAATRGKPAAGGTTVAGKTEPAGETKREGSGGLDLNVRVDSSRQATKLQGGGGVTINSGVQPAAGDKGAA